MQTSDLQAILRIVKSRKIVMGDLADIFNTIKDMQELESKANIQFVFPKKKVESSFEIEVDLTEYPTDKIKGMNPQQQDTYLKKWIIGRVNKGEYGEINSPNRIAMIKDYRSITQSGLSDAKNWIVKLYPGPHY